MMSIRVRVACVCVRDEQVVLMKKLVPTYSTFNRLTPPGGGVEAGETLEQACVREVAEETGLSVGHPELKGVVTYIDHRSGGGHAITFFFVTRDVCGEHAALEPHKHIPLWVDAGEARRDERIPDHYGRLIERCLADGPFFNATEEVLAPDGKLLFTMP